MSRHSRLAVTLWLCGAAAALAASRGAPEQDVHTYLDRPTRPFPADLAAPREGRPFLSECVTPMQLVGHLHFPRDRGGFYGAELREAPRFDGVEVQAPGFFRLLRAEDAIGSSRGPGGMLGHRDPFLLRGEMVRRTYKAKREPWEPPGLEETRVFAAGSVERTPFVSLRADPRHYFEYLKGRPMRLQVLVHNPTDHPLRDLVVNLHAEPRDSSFPLERRLDLEHLFEYTLEERVDVHRRGRESLFLRLPPKPSPAVYREAERVALSGQRWPYPPILSSDPVHEARAEAGQDLQRLLPRRTLLLATGAIPTDCAAGQAPVAVRFRRTFRSFGVVLDGLDLEILAGWSRRDDARFLRLVDRRGHELSDWIRPVVVAALEAKQRRVPVVRRPGGIDEFDVMALHLWGAIDDGDTHFATGIEDGWKEDADELYRHDGRELPTNHREELRRHLERARGRRTLRDYNGEGRLSLEDRRYPVEDHALSEALRRGMDDGPRVGRVRGSRPAPRAATSARRTPARTPASGTMTEEQRAAKRRFEESRGEARERPRAAGPPATEEATRPRPTRPGPPPPRQEAAPPLEEPPPPPVASPPPVRDEFDDLFGEEPAEPSPEPAEEFGEFEEFGDGLGEAAEEPASESSGESGGAFEDDFGDF